MLECYALLSLFGSDLCRAPVSLCAKQPRRNIAPRAPAFATVKRRNGMCQAKVKPRSGKF
jgi:hypothetical protein